MTQAVTLAQLGGAETTLPFRNRIINGSMTIDQRNAGAAVTANGAYPVDRFLNQITYGSLSFQQSSTAPVGFKNSVAVTVTSGGVISASDRNALAQWIEGYNIADLDFGNANAKTVTLSFWVRSSLTGTFSGCVSNAVIDRSFVFTYTINSANTWEQKTVTITGETSGTWQSTNGQGLRVAFDLGTGTDRLTSTINAWQAADYRGATGAVRLSNTTGATWQVTGVQLETGTVATPFERRPFGMELALCQRYFYKTYNTDVAVGTSTGVGSVYCETLADGTLSRLKAFNPRLPVSMRVTPTVTLYSQTGTADRINVYSNSASTLTVSSVQNNGTNSLLSYIQTSTNGVAAQTYEFHATASAEL
jgi:hypothetical protein